LLIARLGLRGVDVKRLEFGDFDWPANRLFVTQAKTRRRVQLPLLKEVGWGGDMTCRDPKLIESEQTHIEA
jgi:hypothetical protein